MLTLALSFDNLGEATALERGSWDGTTPLGCDPSVTIALPRLLETLDGHGLHGTFCVEAINCELNPGAVDAIATAGHEIALHAWRHEPWAGLSPEREDALMRRSRAAFAGRGLHPRGFRPPGGGLTTADPGLLAAHGVTWCSPSREAVVERDLAGASDGVALVPFDWELVDAYLLMESFATLRAERGDPPAGLTAAAAGEALRGRLLAPVDGAAPRVLIMHPFLMLGDAWWDEVGRLLAAVTGLVARGEARCLTVGEVAAGLRGPGTT